jgi:hypothetical protein
VTMPDRQLEDLLQQMDDDEEPGWPSRLVSTTFIIFLET